MGVELTSTLDETTLVIAGPVGAVVVSPSGTAGVELTSTLDETTLVTSGPVGAVVVSTPGTVSVELTPTLDETTLVIVGPVSEGAGVLPAATELGRLEVEVKVTVDTVLDVVTKVDEPEVIVAVTGQVVSVT